MKKQFVQPQTRVLSVEPDSRLLVSSTEILHGGGGGGGGGIL